MKQINRKTVEYRYYEMPPEIPLLGDGWVRPYGELGPDALHFHNHLEIGYCYEGHGALMVEQLRTPYGPGTYSVIPHNVCHTTVSDDGMLCRCEYLFIDAHELNPNLLHHRLPRRASLFCGRSDRQSDSSIPRCASPSIHPPAFPPFPFVPYWFIQASGPFFCK